ncbi:PH domain-containing protein [Daejeonella oryzae]|uniref:PH domain-containing protein n=1 Tax=Daejeonella oryzae TaxID=1122943 RepID=UPI0004081D88|nr:PH domain-containing protein [Daejeonella oryzae]
MWIEQYLTDEQDPKTAEKVLIKLRDMLTSGEAIIYLAIQKKPAVTLIPDCIAVTNKRIVFCLPGNLGLTTNFVTFTWNDIKEVSFKEEFFGSKFITVPQKGENLAIDYIPKVQARKLYQFCNEQLEKIKELERNQDIDDRRVHLSLDNLGENDSYTEIEEEHIPFIAKPEITEIVPEPEDEVTLKLKKLKSLFEKQLITQEEYESKKADILSQF